MCRTISLFNHKGGVAKSMSTVHIASELGKRGNRVLVVDTDLQGDASNFFCTEPPEGLTWTMADIIRDEQDVPLDELIRVSRQPFVKIAPADIRIGAVEKVDDFYDDDTSLVIRDMIEEVADDFDYAILDCPPRPYLTSYATLLASDLAVLPIAPSIHCFRAIPRMRHDIARARGTNPGLQFCAFASLFKRTKVSRQFAQAIANAFNGDEHVLKTSIPIKAAIEEAYNLSMAVTSADFTGLTGGRKGRLEAAQLYISLVDEILERLEVSHAQAA